MAIIAPEVTVKGFKKCCISDEIDRKETKNEVGKVGTEYDSGSSK
jgi:hypothetical protein